MTERRTLNRRRIMREFVIKELSAVDRPAQGGALAVLVKRVDTSKEQGMSDFEKVMERPRAFNSLEDAMAHLAKMEQVARERPDVIAKYNSDGEQIAKAESERIAKARCRPPAVEAFEERVDGIAKRDGVSKLRALENARLEHPEEFELYQRA